MKQLKENLALITIVLISFQVIAQDRTITGKVTAFQSIALSNIKILAKNAKTETLTDKYGNYEIKCSNDDVLSYKSESFENVKKKIKGEPDIININLYFANTTKNKETAIEFGYLSKDTLEFALIHLPNQKKDFSMYTDIYAILKSQYPYLQISADKKIAGLVFNTGTVMLMVDGATVNDISYIQPSEVTSVEVLKRPEDTTIYGINGGNGVVIINTRRNK